MKAFTFAIITYNQQAYIIEHLESIRYQIENYGKDRQIHLLLRDDCSGDNTVALAKKWIDQHKALFHEVTIHANEQNCGIVKNYAATVKNIKTEKFKILAGDDFYFSNDVFQAVDTGSFIVSPTIKLYENGVKKDPERWLYKEYLLTADCQRGKKIRRKLRYQMSVETPGVFWDASLINEELYRVLEPYTWIEDVPLWNYLLSKRDTLVTLCDAPQVVYRMTSGISQNTKHEKNLAFEEDVRKLRSEIQTHYGSRVYLFRQGMIRRALKFLLRGVPKLRSFDACLAQAEESAQAYVDSVQAAAAQWMQLYG